jgi:penicillin G amidase
VTAAADLERLRRLGRGQRITALCEQEGWSRDRFDDWWADRLRERSLEGRSRDESAGTLPIGAAVEILRDGRGIPHIFAGDDHDLFVGYGYAMAQDRLFQLDLQRRKGHGTVAALIGPEGVEMDRVAHTIDLPALAAAELERMDPGTRALLDAFAEGVEGAARDCADALPIEYALLDARWEPWSAFDSAACAMAYRWQFTGRPHVRAGPELLKRHLGDERFVAAVLDAQREADTPILPPDAPYPPGPSAAPFEAAAGFDAAAGSAGAAAALEAAAGFEAAALAGRGEHGRSAETTGSNDWVVAGRRSRSGKPLLASDPHMPYQWASAFYEVGLHGGSFDAVGAGFVGLPGLAFGRNRDLAWGFTNNICSLRDLYQERPMDGEHHVFEHDGRAEPATVELVTVAVRDGSDAAFPVIRTRNGPLVDDILPPEARGTGPVSMRWLGTEPCDWPAAQLRLCRATTVAGAVAAIDGWLVPTFSLVLADTGGGIGYAATGRIPIRASEERGYRPGWDSAQGWTGLIPTEAMPRARDPERGWLASANNRPAPHDYPWPLSGTWDEGYRARHIGRLIESATPLDRSGLGVMHADVRSLRAEDTLADLVALFEPLAEERERRVIDVLRAWDLRATPESAGAAIHTVLFTRWSQAVMAERVADRDLADYLANWGLGLAAELARADRIGWFAPGRREAAAVRALREAVTELEAALGPDPTTWRWGAIHRLRLRHPLGGRGDLAELLDKPAVEVGGDLVTLNNSGYPGTRPDAHRADGATGWEATSGAGYRLEVDLGEVPPAAWTITGESQSGLPGNPHYDDQRADWATGKVQRLPLDRVEVERQAVDRLTLAPGGPGTDR